MEFMDYPKIIVIIGLLSIPIYGMIAKIFYADKFEDIGAAMKFLIWPELSALFLLAIYICHLVFLDDFWKNWDAAVKFSIFITLCFGWVAAIAELIVRHAL